MYKVMILSENRRDPFDAHAYEHGHDIWRGDYNDAETIVDALDEEGIAATIEETSDWD